MFAISRKKRIGTTCQNLIVQELCDNFFRDFVLKDKNKFNFMKNGVVKESCDEDQENIVIIENIETARVTSLRAMGPYFPRSYA